MMLSLHEIARAVRGHVAGRQVLAPGPNHSHRDRSLSIRLSEGSADGFVVHSHSGDDWRECRDHVADALGLPRDRWREQREPNGEEVEKRLAARRRAEGRERAEMARRRRFAAVMWREAGDPRGTPVEAYLNSRGLRLEVDVANRAIRFHPRCPWGSGHAPAMVAAMRCARTGAFVGLHRTALDREARKLGRKMYGAAGAIMLDAADTVTTALAVGEGIESVLAGRQLGIGPAWALGSTSLISTLPVLPGVQTLTLLVENDENGASERAGDAVSARWHEAGRTIDLLKPRVGKDMNDALLAGRSG